MDLDDCGIDHRKFEVWFIGASLEEFCENIRLTPIAETAECSAPIAEMLGQVAPRRAGANHPKHSFDEKPIVTTATTGIGTLA